MKNNIIIIRTIIGFIFVGIILIVVSIIEVKDKDRTNKIQREQTSNIYNMKYSKEYDLNEIFSENIGMSNLFNGQDDDKYKDEINSLIDKGERTVSNIEAFIYTDRNYFFYGEYKKIMEFINLSEFKEDKYKFSLLKDTDNYIWGSFYNENDNEECTYIIINKLDGKLKALNNASIQLLIY